MKRYIAACTCAVLLSAPMASAQTAQSAVEGVGLRTCADVTTSKAENSNLYQGFGIWLSGFLTAANAFEKDTFDLTPWQPIEMSIAQVAKYCEANPDRRMAQAAAAYLAFLRPNRLQEPSKMISLRNGEKAVFVYEAVMDQIRDKLRATGDLGADAGTSFDDAFGQAILAYQKKHKIPATGLPDTPTLVQLLR